MLNLLGPHGREPFCDRVSRGRVPRIGSLGGRADTPTTAAGRSQGRRQELRKSVIFIYLVGGPPHLDMFDLKPLAPREVAGPFRPIATNVPGIEICEHMPRLARRMDRMAVVRSIADCQADHDAFQCFTGRDLCVVRERRVAHRRRDGRPPARSDVIGRAALRELVLPRTHPPAIRNLVKHRT